MIYIKKSKNKQFRVVVTSDNGEPLSVSEALKSKQSAWKNIKSQMIQYESLHCFVEDETVTPTLVYKVHENGERELKHDLSLHKIIKSSKTYTTHNPKQILHPNYRAAKKK